MSACNSFSSASVSMGAGAAPDVLMRILVRNAKFQAFKVSEFQSSNFEWAPNVDSLLLPCRGAARLRLCHWFLFRRFILRLQTCRSQQLVHVKQDDQTSRNFPQARNAVQPAFLKNRRWSFDGVSWNLQNLGSGIDNEARQTPGVLDYQDAVVPLDRGLFLSETLAQVHDGDDFAAQVDDAFEVVGGVGHGGDLRHPHDFVQRGDGHAISFASHLKTHDMEFAAHDSGSSGTA